ncbi:MAG: NAD-binding protein [Actinophytocola sp.]|nr:NAD-binding protein [Actinophytocola sp.]
MTTLFVGLGRMGAPMARRHTARHETVLFDIDHAAASGLADELGSRALPSLAEVPDEVNTVVLMLPDSGVVESVLLTDGLLARLPTGSLVIDMGSSEPANTRRLAEARGVGYVDAPVSGGVAKALNNLLSATNLAAAGEVLTVAKTFGIEADVMVDVLNASTGRSQATEVKYPRHVLTGSYDSGFAMDLMIKDLGIARSLAREQGANTPVTGAAFDTAVRAPKKDVDRLRLNYSYLRRGAPHNRACLAAYASRPCTVHTTQ